MEYFKEWMSSRPTAIAIPPSIIAMSIAGSGLPLSNLLTDMDVMLSREQESEEHEKQGLLVRTAVGVSALVADYVKHVDEKADTVLSVAQDAINKKIAPGTALFRRYVEMIQRMATAPTTIRELYDFEKMKKLTVLNGKHASRKSSMFVPSPGKHMAQQPSTTGSHSGREPCQGIAFWPTSPRLATSLQTRTRQLCSTGPIWRIYGGSLATERYPAQCPTRVRARCTNVPRGSGARTGKRRWDTPRGRSWPKVGWRESCCAKHCQGFEGKPRQVEPNREKGGRSAGILRPRSASPRC